MRKITNRNKRNIKNINARLRRRIKVYETAGLDIPVNYHTASEFKTNKEARDYVKKANKFLDKKEYKIKVNTYGFYYTQDDIKEFNSLIKQRNKQKRKEWNLIKDMTLSANGEKISKVEDIIQIADISKYNQFKPKKKNIKDFKNRDEFERYKRLLLKEGDSKAALQKAKNLQDNLISSLYTVYGDDADKLANVIKSTSTQKFLQIYYSSDFVTPDFVYLENISEDKRYAILSRLFITE